MLGPVWQGRPDTTSVLNCAWRLRRRRLDAWTVVDASAGANANPRIGGTPPVTPSNGACSTGRPWPTNGSTIWVSLIVDSIRRLDFSASSCSGCDIGCPVISVRIDQPTVATSGSDAQ